MIKKADNGRGSKDGKNARRTFIKGMGVAAAGAVFAPWPIRRSASAQSQGGGTLVHLIQPEPTMLATYLSTAIATSQSGVRAYAGLLEYDFQLRPKPSVAESWTVGEDGRVITFKLRSNVKFHDGQPLTSADVKYSFLEILKKVHPRGAISFKDLQEIDTPDPYTAVLRLEHPAPYIMKALSSYESPIVPKHLFEKTDVRNSPYASAPVGAGPFKFVEWKRGGYIRFDRNPNYFKSGQPHLERIVQRSIADAATRTAVLERGEVHLCGQGGVPMHDAAELAKLPHIAVTTKGNEYFSPIAQLEFNTKVKPFDDKRVRQAVSYAIDREFVLKNIWFGFGKLATGPISSALPDLYSPEVKNYHAKDGIDIANRLLDDAGYKRDSNGVRFEVIHDITPYGEEWKRLGDYVRQRLEFLGIKTTLRLEDVATWLRRVYTNYDFQFTNNWPNTFSDPVIGVYRQLHSNAIRPGAVFVNDSRWSSKRTDELMDHAQREPDARKRAQYYKEFQQIVVEECPIAYLVEIHIPTVYNKKFTDVIVGGLGILDPLDQARSA